MSSFLSMTTHHSPKQKSIPYKKGRLWWKVKTTPSGDMRLVPVKDNVEKVIQDGTMMVTMTSKMIQNGKVEEAVSQVSAAGGNVRAIKGRRMEIDVEGINIESVGDVLDSFGCQWDVY
jgi:hypothetical protein